MSEIDYKNAVLNSWKSSQDLGDGVLDQIAAYGESSTGSIVWLSNFLNINWATAINNEMKMVEDSITLDCNQVGILYGFKIVSNDGLVNAPNLENAEITGFAINVTNRTINSDESIIITETVLGIGG